MCFEISIALWSEIALFQKSLHLCVFITKLSGIVHYKCYIMKYILTYSGSTTRLKSLASPSVHHRVPEGYVKLNLRILKHPVEKPEFVAVIRPAV